MILDYQDIVLFMHPLLPRGTIAVGPVRLPHKLLVLTPPPPPTTAPQDQINGSRPIRPEPGVLGGCSSLLVSMWSWLHGGSDTV